MSARSTQMSLLGLAVVAAALGTWLALTEPEPQVALQDDPAVATGQPEAARPGTNSETRVPKLRPRRPAVGLQADAATPTNETPVSADFWPGSAFTEEEFDLTKIQIYRQFQRRSEDWTVETYQAKAARADELSGREIYELYTYLRACHRQPRSVDSLDQRVERIRGSERMNRRMSPEEIEGIVDNYRRRLIRCETLPDDQALLPLMLDWLTLAANRGFPQAQIAYHRSARWLLSQDRWGVYRYPERVREYQQLAPAFLEAALKSGHHDALYEYSLALRENIIFDEDPVASYAYAAAADMAATGGNSEAQEIMALLDTVLNPDQLREARESGRDLCQTYCRLGPA
ncbi:MAG: hypothetical protein AAF552_15115 [Pseudomonadota bacterium]